jgi:CheY-like chemotaxis protein
MDCHGFDNQGASIIQSCSSVFNYSCGDGFLMSVVTEHQSETEKITPLRVLVVDDDLLNRSLMKTLLSFDGHQVDLASDGLEAFDAVKFQRFDVVFMDLQMPLMDGIEASRRIREWENGGQHTFIVALTASYLPEEGHRLFEVGIDNYISKPFELKHIEQLLKYIAVPRTTSPSNAGTVPPPDPLPK